MGAAAHCERGAAGVVQEDGGVLPRLRGRAVSLGAARHAPCPLGRGKDGLCRPYPQTQCLTPIYCFPSNSIPTTTTTTLTGSYRSRGGGG